MPIDPIDPIDPLPDSAFGVMDWTDLPSDERACLRWMLRNGEVSVDQTAEEMQLAEEEAYRVLESLVERRLAMRIEDRVIYTGHLGHKKARFKPGGMWDDLSQKLMDD